MATCTVRNTRGQAVAKIIFQSSPPDTDAVIYSASGQTVGTIKARHAVGEGTVYDTQGRVVGTVFGNAIVDDVPCMAVNSNNQTIGGVVDGRRVMWGNSPDKWSSIGIVETESWTTRDDQGLKETMIAIGKGDPGSHLPTFSRIVQVKQRILAGVAALLLHQLGNGVERVAPVGQPTYTVSTARAAPSTLGGPWYLSTGCLVLTFLFCGPLWSFMILKGRDQHATWVIVLAWIVLACSVLWCFIGFLSMAGGGH
jgi:hypothetical protein